ncbi:MAG: AAC(3) family N-acetyltransferase [Chloroflexi bacterium]|nr:AAC(3) family N-acetyltransferase [Chloroflexota bacterium]
MSDDVRHLIAPHLAVLLRQWNRLPLAVLAALLEATPAEVLAEGERLGLPAWQEPSAPEPLRELTTTEWRRTQSYRAMRAELWPARDPDRRLAALQSALERAENITLKNTAAEALRKAAETAIRELEAVIAAVRELPDLPIPGSDGLQEALLERMAYYRRLVSRTYAPYIGRAEVAEAFRALGVREGGILLVHSAYASLGNVLGGAEAVIAGLHDVLDADGTLVLPTLSQRRFAKVYQEWHLDRPSDTGYLTEYFRHLPGVLRSDQATHSVAAQGPLAYELTREHGAWGGRERVFGASAFARSSPWQKMIDRGGQVAFIGVDMNSNTST